MKLIRITCMVVYTVLIAMFFSCEPEDNESDIEPAARANGRYIHTQTGLIIDMHYDIGLKWGYVEIDEVGTAFPPGAKGFHVVADVKYMGENLWQGENFMYVPGRNPEWSSNGFVRIWREKGNGLRIGTQFYDKLE
ncbi:hypothetical protein [Sphingobacterium mizutaii]|uniref:hypothetical protein n=1 Tax=Sphingobacterium mizutaii TaxID=1010 RepID=UPI003D975814